MNETRRMKNKYILRVIVNLYASFEKLIFFFFEATKHTVNSIRINKEFMQISGKKVKDTRLR